VIFIVTVVNSENVLAQNSPVISYTTPQVYTVGSVITPLSPTNTGGAVYPANYSVPANFVPYTTPFSIAIDGSGNVYTTNNSTGDLTKYNAAGTALFTVNTGSIQASEIAVDGLGNIYVSQFTTSSVLKYNATGTLLATITGFTDPYGITFDASNNAYVADFFTGDVFKINAGTTIAFMYLTGFTDPYGIAIDASGNIYVSEQGPGDIIKVAAGTLTRTTFASGFNGPRHLNIDLSGNIYVADYGNNAIKRINPAGVITSVLSAGLISPRQVAFDSSGNLFVANYGANTLIKALATAYSINAPLPSGLNFDTSTGQITGTPTAALAATTFTITAYNTGGTSRTPLTITVGAINAAQQPPTVNTLVPGALTTTTATLNGFSNYAGSSTLVSFTYGTDPNLINGTTTIATTNSSINAANNNNSTLALTGLTPLTTYYYRVTATDASGTTAGSILSFVTLPSQNASLSNLAISSGTLSPVFASGTSSYTVSVSNATASVTVTPATADPNATITVNGTTTVSGSPSAPVALNVGNNTITTVVTAQDGTTIESYSVTVNRAGASNASLSNLAINSGTLSPVFASGTTSYTASVNTASVTIRAATADPNATLTVNGTALVSGNPSAPIALNVGNNTITTAVTAQDGTTMQSYTIVVTRIAPVVASSNANLSNLAISSGTLSPVFASGTSSYTVSVSNATASVTVTPATSDATATVTVNGTKIAGGSPSAPVALNVGNNTITTVVTAQDGTTIQSYTVTVNRAAASNASLSNLAISSGTLSPVFASGTSSYTVSVSNATASVTITPATADPNTTITVNGTITVSGSPSAPVALNVGNNTITTVVTAQDGTTTQSYTVTVTRAALANASLSNLAISSGTLSPVFASGTSSYTASVSNATASVTVTPATADPNATITVNGTKTASGSQSAPVALNVGNNTITTVVTAQDGITKQSYTVTVNRAASSNASLSNLAISSGTLSPKFTSGTSSYTASVSNATASVTITPAATDPNAAVTVNGTKTPSGSASASVALNVGNNTITTVVTAQDGTTTQSYTIIVNRHQPESLASITTSAGTLTPTFSPATFSYNVLVSNATLTIAVTSVTADVSATLTINGTPIASGTKSTPISLSVGNNKITTVVTSSDGTTTQAYTLTVMRQALSSNAGLVNLALSNGSLSPGFATGTNSYSVSVANDVASIKLTPTTSDATATVTVNGMPVTSGATSASQVLYVGANTITTVVTAQDGLTRNNYTVIVTRAGSSNANLSSLAISNGNLNPVFAPGTTGYKTSVANDISSVTVTPIISDPNATVTVEGAALSSGVTSAPIQLKVGTNTITTVVTAQDGKTMRSYTVTVTRAPSSNANLAGIALSSGSLSPTFATGTKNYKALVSHPTASVTLTPTVSDPTATVTVNGKHVASGSASANQRLIVGNNIITTVVTAQDGITKDIYTVTVVRATNNLDTSLLALSSHTPLRLESGNGDVNYTTTVGKSVGSLTVTRTTTNSNVTLKVNGSTVTSGSVSKPITLNEGPTTISLLVTSKDGATSKNYELTVKRPALSDNANLSGLKISNGTLSPAFDPAILNYTVSADSAISTLAITPVTGDINAILTINNSILTSGTTSAPIVLDKAENTIAIVVNAEDGKTTQSYTITVNKQKSDVLANANGQVEISDKIVVHQAVSPNGDGINDFLLIEGIENYPGNKVAIINRNGTTIYNVNEYNNSSKAFDGHSNIDGRLQQPGTYFYIIEYTVNGEVRRKTGYFILKF